MKDLDVIILGAGAAGLSAAAALSQSHLRYIVLEARDRVGGRILPSGKHDLGAEFVHGDPTSTLALQKPHSLSVENLDLPSIGLWGGREISAKDYGERMEQVSVGMKSLDRENSVAQFLESLQDEIDPETLFYAKQFYEGFNAAFLDKLGTSSLVQTAGEEENLHRLSQGYGPLLENLMAEVKGDVRLGWKVREVTWTAGRVKVRAMASLLTPMTQFTSKAALVTFPLSLLKGQSPAAVKFQPALDAKKSAFERLEVGNVLKLSLVFESGFPESVGFGKKWNLLLASQEEPFHVFWWGPKGSDSIIAWAGGPKANALATFTPEQKQALALDCLARTLALPPAEVHGKFETMVWHDWTADPFSAGAYAYGGLGGKDAFAELAAPLEGTLFFAGEATHPTKNGTVSGAIESGQRAAKEIIKTLW